MRGTLRKATGAVMVVKEERLVRSSSVRPSKEMGFYSPAAGRVTLMAEEHYLARRKNSQAG